MNPKTSRPPGISLSKQFACREAGFSLTVDWRLRRPDSRGQNGRWLPVPGRLYFRQSLLFEPQVLERGKPGLILDIAPDPWIHHPRVQVVDEVNVSRVRDYVLMQLSKQLVHFRIFESALCFHKQSVDILVPVTAHVCEALGLTLTAELLLKGLWLHIGVRNVVGVEGLPRCHRRCSYPRAWYRPGASPWEHPPQLP